MPAPTPPTALTTPPTAPSRSDAPPTFIARMNAFLAYIVTLVGELGTTIAELYAYATSAYNDATTATTKAGEAAASAGTATTKAGEAAASAVSAAGSASTSAGWSATSTTSMALTAGAKSLTIQTGKQFTEDTRIRIKRTSDPSVSYAFTSVGTYTSGTGVLTFTLAADDITGSGTYTDWTVELSGAGGKTGTGVVPQSVGFTLTGGTSSKTLTVDADATISDLIGGGDASNADVVALALEVATLKGSAMGLSSGVSDAFEDAAGVDAAGSTNEGFGAGKYSNAVSGLSVDQPTQTSNSAPTGYVTSASINNTDAFRSFDDDNATYWGNESGETGIVTRQFNSARCATAYTIRTTGTGYPSAWTIQGSNDGSSWITLDTKTTTLSANSETTFSIAASLSYVYFRMNITATSTGILRLAGLAFTFQTTATLPSGAMSLRSVAYTALSAPTTAMITVAADLNGGAVNTDLIAYASRDNGTTWTAVTLTAGRTLADGTTIYSGTASISAQPSGTNMKWRIDTSGDFLVEASAVALQWS